MPVNRMGSEEILNMGAYSVGIVDPAPGVAVDGGLYGGCEKYTATLPDRDIPLPIFDLGILTRNRIIYGGGGGYPKASQENLP